MNSTRILFCPVICDDRFIEKSLTTIVYLHIRSPLYMSFCFVVFNFRIVVKVVNSVDIYKLKIVSRDYAVCSSYQYSSTVSKWNSIFSNAVYEFCVCNRDLGTSGWYTNYHKYTLVTIKIVKYTVLYVNVPGFVLKRDIAISR